MESSNEAQIRDLMKRKKMQRELLLRIVRESILILYISLMSNSIILLKSELKTSASDFVFAICNGFPRELNRIALKCS